MKTKFEWYLSATPNNMDEVWKSGVLTVDANVLLDLYRYHKATCDSILAAIGTFGDRVWISHQAANEFFANRKRVIASSEKTFTELRTTVDELGKSVDVGLAKLRGFRLMPRQILDELSSSLSGAIDGTRSQIAEVTSKYPNYLDNDAILQHLLSIFDGRIGDAYDAERRGKLTQEADQRIKLKQPPGYMDEGKDGDRKYGDFLLWSQIKDYAKSESAPLIFVTSEQKEDWWERVSGRTLGPRMELIQEFVQETGQQIFIYQTGRFIELYAKRAGKSLQDEVVEEIREVTARRTRAQQPAANVEHLPQVARPDENIGTLEIDLLREVRMITASGHLDPEMEGVPDVRATVTRAPSGCPPVDVRGATGTTFDFNVHVRPLEGGKMLPIGHYVIEYECICESETTKISNVAASD
jgi:hypothetical protein